MAAPGRIDVWRLQGFPEVSSSEIEGLPSPSITLPPCSALQNKETHVIKFLLARKLMYTTLASNHLPVATAAAGASSPKAAYYVM